MSRYPGSHTRRCWLWLAGFMVVVLPGGAYPQQTRHLFGSAVDSASGAALQRSWVCASIRTGIASSLSRCSAIDDQGRYSLDSLPMESVEITLACDQVRGFGKRLATDTLRPGTSNEVLRDWVASTAGCDRRPIRKLSGIFGGHYTPGFESSEFIPCASDGWFLLSDSLDTYSYDARRAWVTWPPSAPTDSLLTWPEVPADAWGNPRYYVRWRGTVVGPGRYGHMGVSPFEFMVDSVLEVSVPARNDCLSARESAGHQRRVESILEDPGSARSAPGDRGGASGFPGRLHGLTADGSPSEARPAGPGPTVGYPTG